MKTDLTSIIISLIVLSAFFVPILLDQLFKRKNNIEHKFLELAKARGLKITQYDAWDNSYALGIDQISGSLFYLNLNGKDPELMVDLKKVNGCTLLRNGLTDSTHPVTLTLLLQNGSITPIEIEFAQGKLGKGPAAELDIAQKWNSIIQSKITKS